MEAPELGGWRAVGEEEPGDVGGLEEDLARDALDGLLLRLVHRQVVEDDEVEATSRTSWRLMRVSRGVS